MSKFKLTKAGRAVVGVVLAVAVAIGVVGGHQGRCDQVRQEKANCV